MQQQERPPPSKLSLKGFLTFPYGSCGVTPFVDVNLDDVLERKHLPPLGLKDFEEYLLYVEQSPENLYFLLWLKEYTTRYHIWAQRTKATLAPATPDPACTTTISHSAQTFFTPGAEYELDVPSDILAPFPLPSSELCAFSRIRGPTAVSNPPNAHPDPAVFIEVALETRAMLRESLSRFVRAASTNVGSGRAACGIAAGTLCLCVAGILPLALTFPGIWLGLLLLISSFNGICLMIYVFGDLRQLRKFELARPVISRPLPVPAVTSISSPLPHPPPLSKRPSIAISKHHDRQCDPEFFSSTSLQSAPCIISAEGRSFSPTSDSSSDSELCGSSEGSSSSFELPEIEVSPAYFDDVPAPEGPATATGLHRSHYRSVQSSITFPSVLHTRQRPNSAALPSPLEHRAFQRECPAQSSCQIRRGESFDFDLLPKSGKGNAILADNIRLTSNTFPPPITIPDHIPTPSPQTENTTPSNNPMSSAIARQQYKCKRTYAPPLSLVSQISSVPSPNSYTSSPSPTSNRPPLVSFMIPSFTAGVPAFQAPMTRVRSPVVIRAQWEVVIRSAAIGLIGAVILVAIFIGAIP
ncbi:uncharacterized protein EDB91DRAFT_1238656 [Suillus paluster]|uniref:uncharacterized protein n=1 Tax=Suillus paluster TaxID=48578 RepID=UPI001B86F26B|nr:uncharacterized protein EDB91DRAFT_1238656 [Suillus paluster]KAG1733034.1 hypothetical protein EDB91DRAFT_1238656 [Suillus paluster]